MDDECYNDVRQIISQTAEGPFANYTFIHPDNEASVGEASDGEASDGESTDGESTDADMPPLMTEEEAKEWEQAELLDQMSGHNVPNPTPSATSNLSTKSNVERLREAKNMLEERLITQTEFDDIKSKVLTDM